MFGTSFFFAYTRNRLHFVIFRSKHKQDITVRLVSLFLCFLLHHRIFSDTSRLQTALDFVQLASVEMSLVACIAKVLPDAFHMGCRDCWGSKQETFSLPSGFPGVVQTSTNPGRKRQRLDDSLEKDYGNMSDRGRQQAVPEKRQRLEGATVDKWGEPEVLNPEWTSDVDLVPAVNTSIWQSQKHSLMPLLGPSALPTTHTTGIVESSMRRISSILPSLPQPTPTSSIGHGAPNVEAVECDLVERFARVVLVPWIGSENDDLGYVPQPRILTTSQGTDIGSKQGASSRGPHDCFTDSITLLVQPGVLPNFKVGMGIGGIWVQLVRQNLVNCDSAEWEVEADKQRLDTTYWYMDQLTMTIPSFYM